MKTKTATHTPTPWSVDFWKTNHKKTISIGPQQSEGGSPICSIVAIVPVKGKTYSDEEAANARFIVKCVNSFDLMLEALKNIENDDEHMPRTAWELIQKAIAKAEGGTQ